jgi:hypothetical protein
MILFLRCHTHHAQGIVYPQMSPVVDSPIFFGLASFFPPADIDV